MSTVKWILATGFFAGAVIQIFLANMKWMEVIDAINSHLAPDKQFSPAGSNLRMFEIQSLYAQLYPDGQLLAVSNRLGIGGIVSFAASAAVILLWR